VLDSVEAFFERRAEVADMPIAQLEPYPGWRKNPKTEDGWFKRTAISLLAALAAFTISLPVGFFLYLSHLQSAFPNDTQNMLGAITSAVLTSLAVGGICFGGCMAIFLLFTLRAQPAKP
jgi:ABC-type Fe3+ transport system permease subunit